MGLHATSCRRRRAFSLLELLVVMAILAILIAVTTVSLRGINTSGNFNGALGNISGLIDQARSQAAAQNTYVWVAFYEVAATGSQPPDVYVGVFASNDGTDPFNWAGSVTLPPGTVGGTTLSQVNRLYHFRGLHLLATGLPGAPATPNLPASLPVFQCTAQGESGPVTLSGSASVYWVIEFAPDGSVRNQASSVDSIWVGLQPAYSSATKDDKNIAGLRINGLTGLVTVYRS